MIHYEVSLTHSAFNLSKCAPPRTSVSPRRPTVPFTAEREGTDEGNPKKSAYGWVIIGTKTLLLCPLHYVPLCFDWGLRNKSPSKLNSTSSISTALILTLFCIEVSTWVCVKD